MRNIEIKASIQDLEALESCAKKLSGTNGTIIRQTDTFFKVPEDNGGRLKLRQFENGHGELIYYKRSDTAGPKLSTYNKITDASETICRGLLEVLTASNGILGVVEKTRNLYLVGQSRLHIDSVRDLGTFVEIEICSECLTDEPPEVCRFLVRCFNCLQPCANNCPYLANRSTKKETFCYRDRKFPWQHNGVVLTDDQTIEEGQKITEDLMEKLGIKPDYLISTAYLDLLMAKARQ